MKTNTDRDFDRLLTLNCYLITIYESNRFNESVLFVESVAQSLSTTIALTIAIYGLTVTRTVAIMTVHHNVSFTVLTVPTGDLRQGGEGCIANFFRICQRVRGFNSG